MCPMWLGWVPHVTFISGNALCVKIFASASPDDFTLRSGDVIQITIPPIGTLENTVR